MTQRRTLAIALLAAALAAVRTSAQPPTFVDSTLPRDSERDSARLVVSPPRPVEGSLVRITVRFGPDSAGRDSIARADTSAVGDTVGALGTGLDSLVRRDTAGVGDTLIAIRGSLFGEALHFERELGGTYAAVGGIPVDAPDSVVLAVIIERGVWVDTVWSRLEIGRGAYRMERLSVAPTFGRPPDSALAARIAREQRQSAEVSRQSHETPRLWRGSFQRPRNARVTSGFGDGRQFNGRVQSRHGGLDLAGAVGAPVVAANRGVVALVGRFYYAGNAIYIDHGRGLVTAYFHLSKVEVAEGDTVEAGQRIGLVGATGRVTGPHLHWVARYGRVSVDPASLGVLGELDAGAGAAIVAPPDTTRADSARARPPADSTARIVAPPPPPPPPPLPLLD